MLTKEKSARVIGDKAYASDPLDAALSAKGIRPCAVERTIVWLHLSMGNLLGNERRFRHGEPVFPERKWEPDIENDLKNLEPSQKTYSNKINISKNEQKTKILFKNPTR
jgi:hypothetical protein